MAYRNTGVANQCLIGEFGNYPSFTRAMAGPQAVSGAVFCPYAGTYTENFTMIPNITLSALPGSGDAGAVIINGTITISAAGNYVISNLELVASTGFSLVISGSAAVNVVIDSCSLLSSGATSISYTNSNANSTVTLRNCIYDTRTTGVTLYTMSSPGSMLHLFCDYNNSAASSTQSNNSNGQVVLNDCNSNIAFSSSGSGGISANGTQINTIAVGLNLAGIAANGTGNGSIINCTIASGTASSIAVGPGVTIGIANNTLSSSAPQYAINGTGTVILTHINATNVISIQPTKNLQGTIVAANIHEYGLLEVASGGTLQIDNGATVQVVSGAVLNLQAGANIDVPLTGLLMGNGVNNPVTAVSGPIIFSWTNVTGTTQTLVAGHAYQANNGSLITFTLPTTASSTFGDTIKIMGLGAGGWTIAQLASQQIIVGNASSTVGATGSVASTNRYDCIELVYSSTSGLWRSFDWTGNLTAT